MLIFQVRFDGMGRLEGRHNGDWSLLDISSADNLENKWTLNDTEDGICIENRDVLIGLCSNGDANCFRRCVLKINCLWWRFGCFR